jgi:hypothetical protein
VNRAFLIGRRALTGAVLLPALIYAGDYFFVRYRMAHPKSSDAFGTVRMERLYAIPQKNGKIDYEFDARQPDVTMPCVRSLFPHMGNSPCWYLQRNSKKPIPMVIVPFARP